MSKRKLVWTRRAQNNALLAAASATWIDLLAEFRVVMGITANLPGTTCMRIRADVFAASLTAGSAPLFCGIRVATLREMTEAGADAAYALNASAYREPDADWMFWRAFMPNHGADPVNGVPNAMTYEIDVRSMRKLEEAQQTLALVFSKETSTSGYVPIFAGSTLLALP